MTIGIDLDNSQEEETRSIITNVYGWDENTTTDLNQFDRMKFLEPSFYEDIDLGIK
jgi:hypothetical protein